MPWASLTRTVAAHDTAPQEYMEMWRSKLMAIR